MTSLFCGHQWSIWGRFSGCRRHNYWFVSSIQNFDGIRVRREVAFSFDFLEADDTLLARVVYIIKWGSSLILTWCYGMDSRSLESQKSGNVDLEAASREFVSAYDWKFYLGYLELPSISKIPALSLTKRKSPETNFRYLELTPTRGTHLDFRHEASNLQALVALIYSSTLLHPACRQLGITFVVFISHFWTCNVWQYSIISFKRRKRM